MKYPMVMKAISQTSERYREKFASVVQQLAESEVEALEQGLKQSLQELRESLEEETKISEENVYKVYISSRDRLYRLKEKFALLEAIAQKLPSFDVVGNSCQEQYWKLFNNTFSDLQVVAQEIHTLERNVKALKAYLIVQLD